MLNNITAVLHCYTTRDQLSRGKHLALQLKRWLAQPTPFDTTTDPRTEQPAQVKVLTLHNDRFRDQHPNEDDARSVV